MADAHHLEGQLRALKESHDRVIERLWTMVALAEKRAAEGDALARYLLEELEAAHDAMKSENIAAGAVLAEAGG
jgi:recombinational DNA repair protein RecR